MPSPSTPAVVTGTDPLVPQTIVGGKAWNLFQLAQAKLRVPSWIVVTTHVFDRVLLRAREEVDGALDDARKAGGERAGTQAASKRARQAVLTAGLDAADAKSILTAYDAAFEKEALVAVRSSCVGEDSEDASFAGQMDSFLFVDRDGVLEHVLRCFASAFSPRALRYRALQDPSSRARGACIIQTMIEPRSAGVLFTANPTSGRRDEVVIAAAYGLGEGVVQDRAEADTYYVDPESGTRRSASIAHKTTRVVLDSEKGRETRDEAVPPELASRPVLDAADLQALTELGRRAEALFGGPQDLEWALPEDGSDPWLLQARPITTLARGRETIFDNANIVEGYPGLSRPLTFTFAREAYEATFREASRRLGVTRRILLECWPIHQNLVALVDGRMYYNLLNWYRLYQLIPGFDGMLAAFEKALGLKHLYMPPRPRSSLGERIGAALWAAKIWPTMLYRFVTHTRYVDGFGKLLARETAHARAVHAERPEPHALVELYEHLSTRLLGPYSVSVLNDVFCQQLFELLRKLLVRWGFEDADSLRNDLMAGESGMQSVEPVHSLIRLAERVRGDKGLLRLFEDEPDDRSLWDRIVGSAGRERFVSAARKHIRLYGDRTLAELKLETPSLSDTPWELVGMLRGHLRVERRITDMEAHERAIREQAEARLREGLNGHPLRRFLMRRLLRWVRGTVRDRENLRLQRSRAFGLVKRVFRALGSALTDRGRLPDPGDVFWLSVEEVKGEVRGHSINHDLATLIALRKAEYEGFEKRAPAPRLHVHGPVYGAPFPEHDTYDDDPGAAPDEPGLFRGIGCSRGVARGRAKVVNDPRGDLRV
ncbi:MAG: PEP/pyruvate-binding domain-containing protein, partial [Planctomycetota bacterium]